MQINTILKNILLRIDDLNTLKEGEKREEEGAKVKAEKRKTLTQTMMAKKVNCK